LHNLILNANPLAYSKTPDPMQPGLKIDHINEISQAPENANDVEAPLRQTGLFDVLNQALVSGPSEDAVAVIAHEIQKKKTRDSSFAFVPINVDISLIDSVVVYVGAHSIARAAQKGGPAYVQGSPDAALLSMLTHELSPEARYYFLNSIVSQLRFPNAHTHYFGQALLELFGCDHTDQEESEIREQITRILLERLIGHWPQPWGLIVTILELVKNDKYMLFEMPIVKNTPEVRIAALKYLPSTNNIKIAERFAALTHRPLS
jgi:CCR4-NOT transcription complex subunit 1